jgi:hypothetical protein
MAINDRKVLRKAWRIECSSNEGDYPCYPDMQTLRACFFTKPPAQAQRIVPKPPRFGPHDQLAPESLSAMISQYFMLVMEAKSMRI